MSRPSSQVARLTRKESIVVQVPKVENKSESFNLIKKMYNGLNNYFGFEDSVEDQIFYYGLYAVMLIFFGMAMSSVY